MKGCSWPPAVTIPSGVVRRNFLECGVRAGVDFLEESFSYIFKIFLNGGEAQVFSDGAISDVPGLACNLSHGHILESFETDEMHISCCAPDWGGVADEWT